VIRKDRRSTTIDHSSGRLGDDEQLLTDLVVGAPSTPPALVLPFRARSAREKRPLMEPPPWSVTAQWPHPVVSGRTGRASPVRVAAALPQPARDRVRRPQRRFGLGPSR
jgi:hypothetical protein